MNRSLRLSALLVLTTVLATGCYHRPYYDDHRAYTYDHDSHTTAHIYLYGRTDRHIIDDRDNHHVRPNHRGRDDDRRVRPDDRRRPPRGQARDERPRTSDRRGHATQQRKDRPVAEDRQRSRVVTPATARDDRRTRTRAATGSDRQPHDARSRGGRNERPDRAASNDDGRRAYGERRARRERGQAM